MNEEELEVEVEDFEQFNWEIKPPYHKFVLSVIKSIGWYIIGILVVLIYTWAYIKQKWSSWKKKKDDMEYDAKYHKNVDLSTELLVATQLAREKMQEKYLKDREVALKKEEERKEKKRQELLRLQNGGSSSYRLSDNSSDGAGPSTSSKSKFRSDYNPLMGPSSSGRYVPPKRSCCKKGGGCG